jgi:hypothetical protein
VPDCRRRGAACACRKTIANGCNLTRGSRGPVAPEEIPASVAGKEQNILDLIAAMQELVTEKNGK